MKMYPSEKRFAEYLESKELSYVFQPRSFFFQGNYYRPDFYCNENKTYYEVIGCRQRFSANRKKLLAFKKYYSDIKFEIVHPGGEKYPVEENHILPSKNPERRKLKKIRRKLKLDYEQLARRIGISNGCLTGWLNEEGEISNLVQAQIRGFIKENE